MDLDALASLPPFDEALIPEAMGILGFDMADLTGGAEEAPEDAFDDARGAKKPKVPGGNQREVQKRYRERKKNYTKDLERKVEVLETQLKELRSAQERANEDEILTHMALGRIAPGGGNHQTRGCGADAMNNDHSANSSVDVDSVRGSELGDCPLEHRRVAEAFHAKISDLRALLDVGASDAVLLGALRETLQFCAPKRAMGIADGPGKVSYQLILNKHAAALNAEHVGPAPVAREVEPKTETAGDDARAETGAAGVADACVGSVCGGPLRTVALDGTVMSEDDVAMSVSTACDAFLMQTPPIEVARLVDWRDDYMDDLRRLYFERQKLGLRLAAAGGALVSTVATSSAAPAKPVADGNTALAGRREKHARGSDESDDSRGAGAVAPGGGAVATVTVSMGGAPAPSLVGQPDARDEARERVSVANVAERSDGARGRTGREHTGAKMLDALAVVDLLKRSVRREMSIKFEKSNELLTTTLSPRTAVHLVSAMLPAMPDPLAIATEAKARGFTGTKIRRAGEA